MTVKCPKCGTKFNAAKLLGSKGGSAGSGQAKARTTEQARAAALAMWEKRRENSKPRTKKKVK